MHAARRLECAATNRRLPSAARQELEPRSTRRTRRKALLPEVPHGDGAHAHETLVELLRRVGGALLRAVRLAELDDGVLAEVVGDGLGRPLRVAVDRLAGVLADG